MKRIILIISLIWTGITLAWSFTNQYGVEVPDNYRDLLDVAYKQTDDWVGRVDLYLPTDVDHATPVVINIHGGGWDHNSKEKEGGWKYLFRHNIAVANVAYRLAPKYPAPAAVEDIRSVIAYLVRHAKEYNINAEQIVLMGSSAGGHLSMMGGYLNNSALYTEDAKLMRKVKIAGVIDKYGVPDMLNYTRKSSTSRRWIGEHLHDTVFMKAMSPLSYVCSTTPPTLIIHGDKDDVVPYEQSVRLDASLTEAGVYYEFLTVPGGKHGRFDTPYKKEINAMIIDFLRAIGLLPRVDVTTMGAVGDGETLCTAALQAAIDRVAEQGGGEVYVPAGQYVTGTLFMRSHVTLRLDRGAVLLGSTRMEDYPVIHTKYVSHTNRYTNRCLISAEGQHDISIIGEGTIDGRGDDEAFRADPNDGLYSITRRPYVIRFVSCQGVRLQDVTLRRSPAWMQHYLNCKDLSFRRLKIDNHLNYNNDGIDLDCCQNVHVADCDIATDDDGVVIKMTNATGKCENILVERCVIRSNCNAVKIGSETNGDCYDLVVRDCQFLRPDFGTMYDRPHRALVGLAVEITDGGTIDGVHADHLTMDGIISPIFVRLANRGRNYYDGGPSQPVGAIRNVTIENVEARAHDLIPSSITAIAGYYVENILLRNVHIVLPGGGTTADIRYVDSIPEMEKAYPENLIFDGVPCSGMYVRHAKNVQFENVRIEAEKEDERPLYYVEDMIGDSHVAY